MARPWQTLARVDVGEGPLELRRREGGDFLITVAGRVLMNSRESRSETALARLACQAIGSVAAPRMLIGGLGMGCTLRAALDALPGAARVEVVELHPVIVEWCRGPLAEVNADALADERVRVTLGDVAARIATLADEPADGGLDAIVLDLYEGPHAGTDARRDPFYGAPALARARRALAPGGVLAVWSEAPDAAFERRLREAGLGCTRHRPGRGGRRHAVYVARRDGR